jgi:hypothetical protein
MNPGSKEMSFISGSLCWHDSVLHGAKSNMKNWETGGTSPIPRNNAQRIWERLLLPIQLRMRFRTGYLFEAAGCVVVEYF